MYSSYHSALASRRRRCERHGDGAVRKSKAAPRRLPVEHADPITRLAVQYLPFQTSLWCLFSLVSATQLQAGEARCSASTVLWARGTAKRSRLSSARLAASVGRCSKGLLVQCVNGGVLCVGGLLKVLRLPLCSEDPCMDPLFANPSLPAKTTPATTQAATTEQVLPHGHPKVVHVAKH